MDVSVCRLCGNEVKTIACKEDPEIIEKMLPHLDARSSVPPSQCLTMLQKMACSDQILLDDISE
jgi:hypothetical protein